MRNHIIRAASAQFTHQSGDKAANLKIIRRMTAEAAADGVKLLCFPEMCVTGYWWVRHLDREGIAQLSEPLVGPTSAALLALSIEYDMVIGAGFVEADAGHFYNTYIITEPNGALHHHRKIHTFVSPHMDSGDEVTVFDSSLGVKISVLTCYDNNISENVRMAALQGAEILLAPHQTGGCVSNDPHIMGMVERQTWNNRETAPEAIQAEFKGDKGRGWLLRWLPSRAHDNGMFILFSNGVGPDDDEIRTGNAMIIDPYGRILNETWEACDKIVTADLDLSLIENSTGRRWLKTRRPDLYGSIAEKTGLEEDVKKVRFDKKGA